MCGRGRTSVPKSAHLDRLCLHNLDPAYCLLELAVAIDGEKSGPLVELQGQSCRFPMVVEAVCGTPDLIVRFVNRRVSFSPWIDLVVAEKEVRE